MNETPPPTPSTSSAIDPMGLDDPALLAEIEAEFADLTKEIQRISAMPRTATPDKGKLIEALRTQWKTRRTAIGDRPEWRKKLDDTIGTAIDQLLEDGLQENADGSIGFAVKGETLQSAGGPVIRGLLEGFAHMLEERFPAPPTAPAPAQDAGGAGGVGGAEQPSTMQSLIGNLGQVLAGALRGAIANVGPSGPAISAAMKSGGTTFDIKMSSGPTKPAPIPDVVPGAMSPQQEVASEQQLNASFDMETRAKFSNAEPASKTEGDEAPPPGGKPSPAANAFFAQLMQGIGQAVTKSFTPPAPPAPTAVDAAPTAVDAAPADAPASQPAASAPEPAPKPASAAPAQEPAPAANALQNIGLLLTQALQKALTQQGRSAVVLKQVPPTPAPTPEAGAAKPDAEGAADKPATEPAAPGEPAKTEAPPQPTLQIDLAGIFGQLFGGKKPPPG